MNVAILMCARKLNLPHRTKNQNWICSEETVRAINLGVRPEEGKGSLGWKGFVEQEGLEPGVEQ